MEKHLVRATLELANAIVDGHFILRSGLHSATYVNKDALFVHPKEVSAMCYHIARESTGLNVKTVVGPEKGGIILAQYVAFHLGALTGKETFAVYAERAGERFELRRGYDAFVKGQDVLVVEDVTTTGKSVKRVVNAVRAAGGNVASVYTIVDRGNVTAESLDVPRFHSMLKLPLETHEQGSCPLCAAHIPINLEIGAGKSHLIETK